MIVGASLAIIGAVLFLALVLTYDGKDRGGAIPAAIASGMVGVGCALIAAVLAR